ncbi:uncharacterized protein Tco025E_08849 [Trypanosoma conorhini]|uniref:Uncharacterized protein n=1 Tax=Trypanosoma conorhini TaxID=83891 RepID=A0A3R7N4W2_9TRYP|nr:uncharacterized protein Tco025E_08849 [Trypanosoma conorhini]RNF00235.1 hypothetical protein Tco025E_08849 [Trypanosoma conorhini]
MVASAVPRQRKKFVKGTNIIVQKSATDDVQDAHLSMTYAIAADDKSEAAWWQNTLRPERNLTHPSEAFLQGIKALRPSARFNTFDAQKARLRRLVKQEKDKRAWLQRRTREVAPTAAMKASVNPHKVPRTGGHAPAEEVRLLSRGRKPAKKRTTNEPEKKEYFHKWKKRKLQKIGRSL